MSRHITLAPRDEHPPRWALVLFALAIIAGVSVLFRWLESQDKSQQVAGVPAKFDKGISEQQARRPETQQPETQRPETRQLVTDLKQLLEAPGTRALVGRQVVLEDVPVQSVVGDVTFWIGPDVRSRVPVVLLGELMERQPETRVQVREGQRVRVFGVVRELRDVAVLDQGYLSEQEREELRRAGFFISAQRVVTLGP